MTTYGSLFTGVGGFDLGCDAAGWQCKFQVEWDKKAASVLQHHWPDVNRYEDVRYVLGGMGFLQREWESKNNSHAPKERGIGGELGLPVLEPVDVITFGFPCQDLSVAGKRAGLDGERSGLFFEATRIIREMREATNGKYPRIVIAENVRGLLNADRGAAMGRCLDELALIGAVEIEWRVLDAQFFGVPQRRRRVFIVAGFDPRASSAGPILSQPESLPRDIETGNEARKDITDSLGGSTESSSGELVPMAFSHTAGIDPQPSTTTTTTSKGQCSQAVAFLALPQTVGTMTTTSHQYGNTQVEEGYVQPVLAPTLTASNDPSRSPQSSEVTQQVEAVHAASLAVRRLTPRECERLQGWPDDHTRWAADGKENADGPRYKMIGNGVAAPVAQWIAERIEQAL